MFKKLFIFLPLLIIGGALFLYKSTIFQEGNPLPLLSGIIKLNLSSEDIVPISTQENWYLSKTEDGQQSIAKFLQEKGYTFVEQMGSGYIFKTETGKRAIVIHRQYSRYYSIWKLPKDIDDIEGSLSVIKEEAVNEWDVIVQAIKSCEVKQVFQAHSLNVKAKLKNEEELSATEPIIDDIIKIAVESREKCGEIVMATE